MRKEINLYPLFLGILFATFLERPFSTSSSATLLLDHQTLVSNPPPLDTFSPVELAATSSLPTLQLDTQTHTTNMRARTTVEGSGGSATSREPSNLELLSSITNDNENYSASSSSDGGDGSKSRRHMHLELGPLTISGAAIDRARARVVSL